MSGPALPFLDLQRLDAGPAERAAFLADLRAAVRDVGFFYLAGHGVPAGQVDHLLDESRRFFALPETEKLSVEMIHSPQFRGYTRVANELTRGRADWREQFDIGPERPTIPQGPDVPAWSRLQGPNLWPAALPSFRDALLGWQRTASDLAIRVLHAFCAALDQPEDAFSPIYARNPHERVKVIRYPGRESTGDDQGVGAHKDSGFLTILLQDRQKGLQIEGEQGWIEADPVPGTFVVNVGELLELASNGYLRATVHRVVVPPPGHERISIACFFGAALDSTVPLLRLPPQLAAEARGPASDPDNPMFREVGANYLKSRLRSHTDVARKHYADLLPDVAA